MNNTTRIEELKYIGFSHPRPDGYGKVTGDTRFLTDISVEGMAHAAPVYSSIPFGKIISIDTSIAEKKEGFIDFITAVDIPGKNQVGIIVEDQPLFAERIVRYVGDIIGLVVAESLDAAREAAAVIQIKYEKFSPYLSIDQSRDASNHYIHQSNIACQHRVRKGDVKKGFAKAWRVITGEFVTPLQEHYYLEPQACIVSPRPDGSIKILGSLQCPFYVQKAVAKALGIPFSQVLVEQAPIGGAFGGKEDLPSEICAQVAVAVIKLNRPIKLVYSRKDDIQVTSKRHPFQMKYKVGVTKNGKLLAAEILLEENAGAYATLSSVVSYRAAAQAMGPYLVPNVKVDSNSYYTNLPPNGAFRGFGSPQATFGHERMMDIIAAELHMDPLELRLKNILKKGLATTTDQKLEINVSALETLKQAADRAEWKSFKQRRRREGRYLYGLGISTCHYGNCLGAAGWYMDGAGVKIQIHRDGSVAVAYGLVEMGQGSINVVTQMVADALGISTARIIVVPTDTRNVPDSGPSVASRNVIMTGNAIRNAAEKILPVLISAAAEMLECDPNFIKLNHDKIMDTSSSASIKFEELTEHMFATNRQMDTLGWWHVRKLDYDASKGIGEAYFTYSYATHIASVRVDTLTGQVYVEKVWAAHDVGKAINPAGLEGQVEGGVAQGIGWATTEDFQMKDGVVLTPNLSTYLLPTSADAAKVETIIIEEPEPEGPWGAKGVGEPSIIPTGAAVANAVSDALSIQMNELPLTPERVLAALNVKNLQP